MLPKQPLRLIFAFEDMRNNNEAVLSRREGIRNIKLQWHFISFTTFSKLS